MLRVVKLGGPWGPEKLADGQWELRYRLHFEDGSTRTPKRRFSKKGLAETRAEHLTNALHQTIDRHTGQRWGWSGAGDPILLGDSEVTDEVESTDTVWRILCDWRSASWATAAGNGRRSAAVAVRAIVPLLVTKPLSDNAQVYLAAIAFRGRLEPTHEDLLDRAVDGVIKYQAEHSHRQATVKALWAGRQDIEAKSLPASRLTRSTLQTFVARLGEGREGSTERRYWSVLSTALNWAADDTINPDGPPRVPRGLTAGIKVRAATVQSVEDVGPVPDDEEMWIFADACASATHKLSRDRWRVLPLVMGAAGLRIGECAALTRAHISEQYPDGTGGLWIRVHRNLAEPGRDFTDSGEATELRGTKRRGHLGNRKGRKTFLPARESKVLRSHLTEFVGTSPRAPVFTGPRGGRLDATSIFDAVWNPAKEAVFPAPHRLADMTPHGFRHLAATRWIRNPKVPLSTAARWGGWQDTATMFRFYDSVMPQDDESAADAMNNE